jgi:glutaredoxin-like protein
VTQQSVIPNLQKAQLKRTLRKDLKSEVTLRLFTRSPSPITIPGRECPTCPKTQQLIEALTGLSAKLHLEVIDFFAEPEAARKHGVTRIPALVLLPMQDSGASDDIAGQITPALRFYGMPLGYQMAVIIESIKTISRKVSPLSMDSRKKLRQVNQPVHIQVMVTPEEENCAGVARLAHALAWENHCISADLIEIREFPALARSIGIQSAPLTVINENFRLAGPAGETSLVEQVLQAGARGLQGPGN